MLPALGHSSNFPPLSALKKPWQNLLREEALGLRIVVVFMGEKRNEVIIYGKPYPRPCKYIFLWNFKVAGECMQGQEKSVLRRFHERHQVEYC